MYKTIMTLATICNTIIGHSVWNRTLPEEDRIKHLPGLEETPSFGQFSGYLGGSTPNYQLHYWFIEAESDSENAPLVLWLNGGPGCSSLGGLLTGNGPFRVTEDERRLVYNPYSWNKFANMLYLESPAGVGFSYAADGNVTADDDLTSLNNLHALLNFLEKFPDFKHRDFYITGASYAGVYVSTLAQRVIKANHSGLNLKGIAVGNGFTNYDLSDDSLMYFINYHGLADEDSWNDALRSCCGSQCANKCMFSQELSDACQDSISRIIRVLDGMNKYNLYSKCAVDPTYTEKVTRFLPRTASKRSVRPKRANLLRNNQMAQLYSSRLPLARNFFAPCLDFSLIYNYLNQKNVQRELHIKADFGSQWEACSGPVMNQYWRTYFDLSEQYMDVLHAEIPVMLFAGDIDAVINYLGILWFVDKLDLKLKVPMKTWFFKDSDGTEQIGGMHKTMVLQSNNASLWYVTVRGSGHSVSIDKPIGAYHIITHFIQKKEL